MGALIDVMVRTASALGAQPRHRAGYVFGREAVRLTLSLAEVEVLEADTCLAVVRLAPLPEVAAEVVSAGVDKGADATVAKNPLRKAKK